MLGVRAWGSREGRLQARGGLALMHATLKQCPLFLLIRPAPRVHVLPVPALTDRDSGAADSDAGNGACGQAAGRGRRRGGRRGRGRGGGWGRRAGGGQGWRGLGRGWREGRAWRRRIGWRGQRRRGEGRRREGRGCAGWGREGWWCAGGRLAGWRLQCGFGRWWLGGRRRERWRRRARRRLSGRRLQTNTRSQIVSHHGTVSA